MTRNTNHDLGHALAAFLDEHRGCGTLDTGTTGEPERVWIACSCGARIERESLPRSTMG
jgi:hypothetical protein